jgi:nucleoside-diphosphate-sugar epimerase/SAM-dependent methyltransferase
VRVLLTGASSFTGFWFAKALLEVDVEVIAPLRGSLEAYEGVRAERVRLLSRWAKVVPNCAFGEPAFLDLVGRLDIDVLCHHAAEARDYRNPDFDALGAAAANTLNFRATVMAMRERGLKAVVATGSVFEPDEGAGPSPRRAFSPYGLSKGLTWSVIRHWCETLNIPLAKFVIANPFGPFEEPRFVSHLVERWAKDETAEVRTPDYLRDNIHVDLLARAYARYVLQVVQGRAGKRFGPCGYLETQGAFALRLQRELASRLGLEGRLTLLEQSDFSEPLARVNSDTIDPIDYDWSEAAAWDGLADYWRVRGKGRPRPAPQPAMEILGAVDSADHAVVAGWLTARGGENPRFARVMVDGAEHGVARADLFREDLAQLQISDGASGFYFSFAGKLDPYVDHRIRVEDRDSARHIGPPFSLAERLVGGAASPFVCDRDFVAVNVGAARYEADACVLKLELFGAATKFARVRSDNAALEVIESWPFKHRYFETLGLDVTRLALRARPLDPSRPLDIGFVEDEALAPAERLLCRNLAPARLPDYLSAVAPENIERVSGPGEEIGRFAATGLATAWRLDQLVRLHFGRGLAECGRVLDWGAGAARVAAPLVREVAPGLQLVAADVDAVNVGFGRAEFPDIFFLEAPFLPPLPFADASFGAIYGVSVFTHLRESVQFAWLKELRRLVAPGAPVIVSVHSEFHLFREAMGRPEILAEALRSGISDSTGDENLGPKLADTTYYRATFHTRRYILERWSEDFDIVAIHTAGNGGAQDFVVLRAK